MLEDIVALIKDVYPFPDFADKEAVKAWAVKIVPDIIELAYIKQQRLMAAGQQRPILDWLVANGPQIIALILSFLK